MLASLAAYGCGEDPPSSPQPDDPWAACAGDCENHAPPEVAEFTPRACLDEACPAAQDSPIRVRFSEPINPDFGGGGTADCVGSLDLVLQGVDPNVGPCLTGSIVTDGVELVLQPDQLLLPGTYYVVHVSERVQDLTGNPMREPFSWSFVTRQVPACGNGERTDGEVCDDGNLFGDDYCAADCMAITGSCGDGALQAGLEVCDDGNTAGRDGCSVRCTPEFREPRVIPGDGETCGIRRDGSVRCWGEGRSAVAPAGVFTELAVGAGFACALDAAGTLSCWGDSSLTMATAWSRIEAGGSHVCGVDASGAVSCIDALAGAAALPPPAGQRASVLVVGEGQACAIDEFGALRCWGPAAIQPPAEMGRARDVALGDGFGCVVGADGTLLCWGGGADDVGLRTPPMGEFVQIAAGADRLCGLKESGGVACWSARGGAALMPSGGGFTRIDLGPEHACGVTTDDVIDCWGEGAGAPTSVPADF